MRLGQIRNIKLKILKDSEIYDLKREEFLKTIDLIKQFNKKREKLDNEKKEKFNWGLIENKISINIWDELEPQEEGSEFGETFIYIEESETYDDLDLDILLSLKTFINENNILPEGVKLSLKYYDSFYKYPILIKEHSYSIYRRWQLFLSNVHYEDLEKIARSCKEYNSYDGIKVDIFSES